MMMMVASQEYADKVKKKPYHGGALVPRDEPTLLFNHPTSNWIAHLSI